MGSKARFAAEILPLVLSGRREGQTYVEPFLGGANIFDKVPGLKIGADSNIFLVAMWTAVRDGWCPPEIVTPEEYEAARAESTMPAGERILSDAFIGFVGAGCSFGGKWFGGFARGGFNKAGPRVYARESAGAVKKQRAGLIGATLLACSYRDLILPDDSVIYCDPPYAGTTGYSKPFDSRGFWEWASGWSLCGHSVFVSEYAAPAEWKCVWEKETASSVTKEARGSKRAVERLFTLNY